MGEQYMSQNEIIDAFKDNAILLGEDGHLYRVIKVTRITYDCLSVDGTRIVRDGSVKMLQRADSLDGPITADIDYRNVNRFAPVIYLGNLIYAPIPEQTPALYIATDRDGMFYACSEPVTPHDSIGTFDTHHTPDVYLKLGNINIDDYTFKWKETLRQYKVVLFAPDKRLLQPSPVHKYFAMDDNGEIHAFIEKPEYNTFRGAWHAPTTLHDQRLATVLVDAVDPETVRINNKEYIYYVTD